jgi:hypothetical protein
MQFDKVGSWLNGGKESEHPMSLLIQFSIRKTLQAETNLGLAFRVGLFGALMVCAFVIAYLARFLPLKGTIELGELFAVFLATTLPMAASIVVSERPQGEDWIPVRLGLATFCRTGLPLFCVLVITLNSKKQLEPMWLGYMVFFYILGILAIVWISVYRLSKTSFGADNNDEDESVPVA